MFRKRILSDAEWNRVKALHSPGSRISAVVRRHVGLGALCEVGTGRIPAVMRSVEFDWDPAKQIATTVPEGNYFEACVLAFEDDRRELIISRKAAETSPFDKYATAHRLGDIVDGVIHELTPTVVVLRLTGGLQGEIPWGLVPSLPDLPQDELNKKWGLAKGDCLRASIVDFDYSRRRVKLDLSRAVRKINSEREATLAKWRIGEASPMQLPKSVESLIVPLSRDPHHSRLSILLVDDEDDITFAFAAGLEDRGHHVITASLAFEAMQRISEATSIDVAVVDQQLTDGSGLDVLHRVAERFPQVRQILLTGNTTVLPDGAKTQIQVVFKPIGTSNFIAIVEGEEESPSSGRMWVGEESVGNLSQMTTTDVDCLSVQVRQVLDNYLGALQEPFRSARIAILRLQKSDNLIQCVRASNMKPTVFDQYADALRFSFIGDVLAGNSDGFFRLDRPGGKSDDRDPLRSLLRDLQSVAIYGMPLKVESQANPMGVFAFLPAQSDSVSAGKTREFRQTVRAVGLAIERATLDARLFRNQRLLVAGSILLGMAHELRNEVQSLTSVADYLLAINDISNAGSGAVAISADSRREKTLDCAQRVQDHTTHLRHLFESVLGLTRSTENESVPLRQLLVEAIDKCRSTAKKDEVFLQVELDQDSHIDRPVKTSLHQVVMNLLLNAIQHVRIFRKPGHGYVRICAKRQRINDSCEVAIRVEDNAFGLDWASRAEIFEPFVTTRSHGTGLGLNVAKMITESHDGQLEVESSFKYLGTTFLLRLPIGE